MLRIGKALVLLVCLAHGGLGQYVGAQVCGSCHADQWKQQTASGHAHALRPAAEHALARLFVPDVRFVRGVNPRYEFARTPTGFEVRIVAGKDEKVVPLQWAFGAGDQAVTFVSQLDEDTYVEHRLSFYSRANGLDVTPGHAASAKPTYPDAVGVVYKTFDPETKIMRCFQCHSTGRLTLGPHMELIPAELGVRCEACHGPGKAHVDAISAANVAAARKAIQNPGRMPAVAQNQLCGDCHRKPQQGETATNWNDAWNTRHQPLYLAQSACFRKSNGALSCVRCHDPHAPLRRNDEVFYNGKCASCHGGKPHPVLSAAGNMNNCVRCHMPAVSPREHLSFANHWIGVYREGSPLRPIRRP
jgi:hypothetical protein